MDFVSLNALSRALQSQDSRSTLNDVDGLVDVLQIIDVLVLSFEKAEHKDSINIAQSVDLVLNWLLNVFDRYDILYVNREKRITNMFSMHRDYT